MREPRIAIAAAPKQSTNVLVLEHPAFATSSTCDARRLNDKRIQARSRCTKTPSKKHRVDITDAGDCFQASDPLCHGDWILYPSDSESAPDRVRAKTTPRADSRDLAQRPLDVDPPDASTPCTTTPKRVSENPHLREFEYSADTERPSSRRGTTDLLAPPRTPRLGRLPTPDLPDLDENGFSGLVYWKHA